MGIIVFNSRSSREFGLEVESPPSYEAPERQYETIEIPGRNGDIQIDKNSFGNVNRSYDVSFDARKHGFSRTASMIMGWLRSASGYARLEDSYDKDFYRDACFKEASEIENIFDEAGKFSIEFECKPQRWFKSGEIAISVDNDTHILNQTFFVATPLISVDADGIPISISIGGNTIQISADRMEAYQSVEGTLLSESITLDCMNHFVKSIAKFLVDEDVVTYMANCNGYAFGEWPQLLPGTNIYIGPEAKLTPRWWTI